MQVCNAASAQSFVGKSNASATLEAARKQSGAYMARVLREGQPTTMEFNQERLNLVVDGTGRIANAFLLHTSGDRARDGAILETLGQIRIDRPPPPGMAQPLTMLILPRSQTPGLECPAQR